MSVQSLVAGTGHSLVPLAGMASREAKPLKHQGSCCDVQCSTVEVVILLSYLTTITLNRNVFCQAVILQKRGEPDLLSPECSSLSAISTISK